MKYAILYQPTQEYVVIDDGDKQVLFVDNGNKAFNTLSELLIADGGYDGDPSDFAVVPVSYDTDGSEYITDDAFFVAKSLIK